MSCEHKYLKKTGQKKTLAKDAIEQFYFRYKCIWCGRRFTVPVKREEYNRYFKNIKTKKEDAVNVSQN